MGNESKLLGARLLTLVALAACGGGETSGGGGTPDASTSMPTPDAQVDASDPKETMDPDGSTSKPDGGMETIVESCEQAKCNPGQHCVTEGDISKCVAIPCDELMCDETKSCEPNSQGGNVCLANSCSADVDCESDWFCSDSKCKADVCSAGERRCDGSSVYECSANGAEDAVHFACQSTDYFDSQCSDASGVVTCSCLGDWDCPAFTVCETGFCKGTGRAPSCSLPAVPFSDTPPSVELFWGGDSPSNNVAHDGTQAKNPAPWATFSQVVNTPIVANLDDDNGDGLVNELDFPEILFVSHIDGEDENYGIVRAIHGGGPNKGADYFAICGSTLWKEGDAVAQNCVGADADPGATIAVGDLNNDGFPEIVYTTDHNTFRILDNTGALMYDMTEVYSLAPGGGNAPSIANLDFAGYAEIIVGNIVYVLGEAQGGGITVTHILTGTASKGTNTVATMSCVADLIPSSAGLEIAAGATLYKLPEMLPTCDNPPCTGPLTGALEIAWDATQVDGNSGLLSGEGFCAIADVWGAKHDEAPGPANPPDGQPELILIDNGDLTILDGLTGKIIHDIDLGGGPKGGAPNVDDFDGDGFMEVASALYSYYIVADLQTSTGSGGSCPDWPSSIARKDEAGGAHNPNPARTPGGSCTKDSDCDAAAVCNEAIGQCVCLHNGWKRKSDDSSSAATSSSVFDFNGDGAAEVLYNDECDFRVYDGTSGEVLFSHESRSRTGTENPVVADVDNDGNAEVVTTTNTHTVRCHDDLTDPVDLAKDPALDPSDQNKYAATGPNGLRVWGDPSDTWAAARRIWNQQSYHVTNVGEGGTIPQHEPESWKTWQEHHYNTYRSQPRGYGVAPDLTVAGVGISSPDAQCGSLTDNIDIAFEIANVGDLRVGPGVTVSFFGTWDGEEEALKAMGGEALQVVLTQSIEPGGSTIQKVNFAHSYNGKGILPNPVRVVVDAESQEHPSGTERECHEDNNDKTAAVDPGSLRADVTVELLSVSTTDCPDTKVETKVRNIGTATASNVVVRYFAGDPAQGGTRLYEEVLKDPLKANEEVTFTATVPALPGRSITIYAAVDPDKKVDECDEANNTDADDMKLYCEYSPQ